MTIYAFGPFELMDATFELRRGGDPIRIERRVYDLLLYLVRHRDRVVSNEELLARVWSKAKVTRSSIARAVRLLRNALADEPDDPHWIATTYGRGYRFIGVVSERRASRESTRRVDSLVATDGSRDSFVGRTFELSQLRGALERSHSGAGHACFIAGDPGMGKTRLCQELTHLARASGMEVMTAWCHDGEGAPSYWPWIQFLRAYGHERTPEEICADLGPGRDAVVRAVPEFREKLGIIDGMSSLSADEARFLFFDGVTRLFVQASRRRPILLVLDDLHNVDAPSLRLLEFFCTELDTAALLILAAHRNADIDLDEGVRGTLGRITRQRHCERIELTGLRREEVAALLGLQSDGRLDEHWINEVHERTGGNPFFVRQMSGSTGGVAVDDPKTVVSVPAAVRDLLAGRIARVSLCAREMLDAASIVSTEWPGDLVRGIGGLALESLSVTIDEGLRAGLIRRLPGIERFGFVHAMIRETLYSELSTAKRRELHRRAVDWLETERVDFDPAELAYHAYHSALLDKGRKALEYSIRAAERATRRLAYEDAATHYTRALEMLELAPHSGLPRRRCELLIGLGESHVRSGDRGAAADAFRIAADHARELRSGELLARIALGRAPGLLALEIDNADLELISLLNEALELCRDAPELRALLLARLALAQAWSLPTTTLRPLVEECVQLADATSNIWVQAFARCVRCMICWSPRNFTARRQETKDVLEWTRRSGDRELQAVGYLFRITTLMEQGDPVDVDGEVQGFDRMAGELRQPQALWYRSGFRTITAFLRGRFEEVRQLQADLRNVAAATGDKNPLHVVALHDVFLAAEQGEFEQGLAVCAQMRLIYPPYLGGYSWFLAELGRHQEAQEVLGLLIANNFEKCPPSLNQLPALAAMAEACDILRAVAPAAALYREMLPYRDRMNIGGYGFLCWGAVARTLGLLATLLGHWSEAQDHFEQSLEMNARNGATVWVVRTRYNYARMFLARRGSGDVVLARDQVLLALPLSIKCGMRVMTQRLSALVD